jgi:plastocyanin
MKGLLHATSWITFAAAAFTAPLPVVAQSALERTPNLSGGWTGAGGRLDFHVVHRFNQSGPPLRQVQNRPTFLLAWETRWRLLLGTSYVTRSALAPGVPNEWEPFARMQPLVSVPLAVQVGYNAAAGSVDGELTYAHQVRRLRAIGAVRVLGNDAAASGTSVAVAGGVVLRVHEHVALAADAGRRIPGSSGDTRTFWGAGIQLRIPYSPHTLSLQATNTDALTLHSASRASAQTRWGFEFTVPVTPARWLGGAAAASAGDAASAVVALRGMQFMPARIRIRVGDTVQWRNDDGLIHTVTAADVSWDSGPLQPDGTWSRRFSEAGTFLVTCTPHPFMRLEVVVG